MWPKLQSMARQYLTVPETSAGMECLFNKAALFYDDLSQAMKEGTLGYVLTIHLPYMKDLRSNCGMCECVSFYFQCFSIGTQVPQ